MNFTDAKVAELEREHPSWQVWVIHRYVGGVLWCARPWASDSPSDSISAESADELARRMTRAEAQQ